MARDLRTELKQSKPFPTRAAEALVSILRTAAVLEYQVAEVLKPYGLTVTQYNALRILRGAGAAGLCGREIGERMIARVPDMPRLLERLETMGLIRRERDASDRRHVTARITEQGLALLERASPAVDAMERSRLARLSDRTLSGIIGGLAAVRDGR
jgi:DNA-binding MarR family transcriptional regulator